MTKERQDPVLESVEMEGQEAVLVQEEVLVEKDKKEVKQKKEDGEKKKRPKRRSFFRKSKGTNVEDAVEPEPDPSPEKISKTRVILIEDDATKQRATQKAKQSRMLLEAALRPIEHTNRDIHEDQREQLIRAAFQFAAEARRLIEGDGDGDVETVISLNTNKGEIAAGKAWAILSARKPPANDGSKKSSTGSSEKAKEEGIEPKEKPKRSKDNVEATKEMEWPTRYTPKDIVDEAEKYAKKARIHLEAILPVFECVPEEQQSNYHLPHPVPTPGIVTHGQDNLTLSTLGFDNTFQETLLSITSLNEILDAPLSPQGSKLEPSDLQIPSEAQEDQDVHIGSVDKKMQAESEPQVHIGSVDKMTRADKEQHFEKATGNQEKPVVPVSKDVAEAKPEPCEDPAVEEGEPMEPLIATVVEDDDEESVSSEVSNNSELERLKELNNRTDSKLKEAMEADETDSLTSWDGVALFQSPAARKDKDKTKKGSKKVQKVEGDQVSPRRLKQKKPQFVEAPENDPTHLATLAWSHLNGDNEEKQPEEVPVKQKKRRFFGWGKKRRAKRDRDPPAEKTKEPEEEKSSTTEKDSPPAGNEGVDLSDNMVPSMQSKEDVGDRYTALSEDNDTFHETATKRLKDREPIVSPVEMMPNQPDPTDVRVVTSLDAEPKASNDSDDVQFADVEIGTDQVEKKIMSRDKVISKINKPRKTKENGNGSAFEKVRTLPNQDGISGIEPSSSLMVEIEEKKKVLESNNSKGEKRERRWWHSFGGKKKDDKGKGTKKTIPSETADKPMGTEESNIPTMSLVSSANTGSSSPSG